ncbi:MAG: tyrosine-protein phosphatase [Gemmataceae bacterium]
MTWTVTPRDPAVVFLTRLRRPVLAHRPLWPSLLRGGAAGLVAVGVAGGWNMVAGDNLHEVQPARVFRSSQMSPEHLKDTIDRRHIRTVVNLRGTCMDQVWYDSESRVTHDANIAQEDVCLSATRLPSPTELRRLLEVLDGTEYPILIHCRQGVDRTGLTAAMVKLLEPGSSLPAARRQLAFAYGYVPYNGTEVMDEFFDLYEEWLARQKVVHSPELFRHWAQREYCPGPCRGTLEPLADFPANHALRSGRVHTFKVRVRNTSVRTWKLTPGTRQGFHLRVLLHDSSGRLLSEEQAGQFDAAVSPGESIDLTVGVPPLSPGPYLLRIDMVDENQNLFLQFGIDPFLWEFRVEA